MFMNNVTLSIVYGSRVINVDCRPSHLDQCKISALLMFGAAYQLLDKLYTWLRLKVYLSKITNK